MKGKNIEKEQLAPRYEVVEQLKKAEKGTEYHAADAGRTGWDTEVQYLQAGERELQSQPGFFDQSCGLSG